MEKMNESEKHDNLLARVSDETLERLIDVMADVDSEICASLDAEGLGIGSRVCKYDDAYYLSLVHVEMEALALLSMRYRANVMKGLLGGVGTDACPGDGNDDVNNNL